MARRQEKYPDTDVFVYENINPKGRITGDCAFRAIAKAMDKPWEEVVMEMAALSCKTGYAINDKKGIIRYFKLRGFAMQKQLRHSDNSKLTLREFCKLRTKGKYVVIVTGHHTTCVIDGKCHDIWNCTNKKAGNYWKIE